MKLKYKLLITHPTVREMAKREKNPEFNFHLHKHVHVMKKNIQEIESNILPLSKISPKEKHDNTKLERLANLKPKEITTRKSVEELFERVGTEAWKKQKLIALKNKQRRQQKQHFAKAAAEKWMRFAKIDLLRKANQFVRRHTLERCFYKWRHDFDKAKVTWKKEFVIQTRHKFSVLIDYFALWRRRLKEYKIWQEYIAEKTIDAQKLHVKLIKRRCLNSWKMFIKLQKQKAEKNEMAYKHMCKLTVKHAMQRWKLFLSAQRIEKQIDSEKLTLALQYREFSLKKLYFKKLIIYKELSLIHKTQKTLAQEHFYSTIISRYLKKWKAQYLQKLVDKEKKLEQQADIFCLRHSGIKYYKAWKFFMNMRKQKKALKIKADKHYEFNIWEKYMHVWKTARVKLKKLLLMKQQAQSLRNKHLKISMFREWVTKTDLSAVQTAKWNEAVEFHQANLMRKYLYLLQAFVAYNSEKRWVMEIASQLARKNRMKQAFYTWLTKLQSLYKGIENWEKAVAYRNKVLKLKALKKWKLWLAKKKNLYKRLDNARSCHGKKMLQKTFDAWKMYIEYKKAKHAKMNDVIKQLRLKLLISRFKRIFKAWIELHRAKALKRIKYMKALNSYNHNILQKTILHWKKFIELRKKVKLRKFEADLHYREVLKNQSLLRWKQAVHASITHHRKISKADSFFSKMLLSKYLATWLKYIDYKKQNEQLKIAALDRRRQMLIRRGLNRWLQTAVVKGKLQVPLESPVVSYPDPYNFSPPERPPPRKPFSVKPSEISKITERLPPKQPIVPVQLKKPSHVVSRKDQIMKEISNIEMVLRDFDQVRLEIVESKKEMIVLKNYLLDNMREVDVENEQIVHSEQTVMQAHERYHFLKQRIAKFHAFKKTHLPDILLTLEKLRTEHNVLLQT